MTIRAICLVAMCLLLGNVCQDACRADDLRAQFKAPPEAAKPWTWWHWTDSYISREGITRDLEAMKKNGLAGAVIFNVIQTTPGPVKIFGPEWFDLLKHATLEADRLGLKLSAENCAGWSTAGGPWVTPELSMQQLSWSQTIVRGPGKLEMALSKPFARMGYYRDVAVVAFPTTAGDESSAVEAGVRFSVDDKPLARAANLTDGDHDTEVAFKGDLMMEFPSPFTAQSLMTANPRHQWGVAELYAETAPGKFVRAAKLDLGYTTPFAGALNSVSFAPVTAKRFKLVSKLRRGGPYVRIGELELGGYRISQWTGKAGFGNGGGTKFELPNTRYETPPGVAIDASRIVDLTGKLSAEGKLQWDVPAGNWTIMRIGSTTTGVKNAPAAAEACGLEVDKMSREAADLHVNATMGKWAAYIGPELFGKTWTHYFVDSYEGGCQNWTPGMPQEFAKRRGYDLRRWLPVMTGRVVGSVEESERFLWDLRRTISDLFADNFYGRFAERAAEFGLEGSAEPNGGPYDFVQAAGRVPYPMAEFWTHSKVVDTKRNYAPVSAGHLYGRKVIGAEAFTGGDPWKNTPASLKSLGDFMMTCGINRFVFHRFAHQPWVDDRLQPGMALGGVGMNFERTNTWWDKSRAWMQYLSRCQYLLQSGLFVADIVYLTDEEPHRGSQPLLKAPRGIEFDMSSSEAVLTRMQARDGRIVLPDGMSYRYLVMQSAGRMTPELMAKLVELIKGGATVIGTAPGMSPSLQDFPACDQRLQAMVTELWGANPGPVGERRVGAGRLIWGKTLEEITTADGVSPDFSSDDVAALPLLHHIHRRMGDTEAYFVAWGGAEGRDVTCTFRVTGKVPEIWNPVTGAIETAGTWDVVGGKTRVTLRFPPSGSVFVVFREPAQGPGPGLQEVKPEGPPAQVLSLDGPWEVRFLSGRGAPEQSTFKKLISWPEHAHPGIKYYSGTAEYRTVLNAPDNFTTQQLNNSGKGSRLFLDLGRVEVIAEVRVNDQELGVLWTPPYRLDITRCLKPGRNTVTVQVANLWVNRMVGDEQFPLDYECPRTIAKWPDWLADPSKRPEPRRMTFSTFRPFTKDTPLMPSGLLGPVRIEAN